MTNIIKCKSIISIKIEQDIIKWSNSKMTINSLVLFLNEEYI